MNYSLQKLKHVIFRFQVPIYRGSKESLVHTPVYDPYYGGDGLSDADLVFTDLTPAQNSNAINSLIEYSEKYEGNKNKTWNGKYHFN